MLYTGALGLDACLIQLCDMGSAHVLPEAGTQALTPDTANKTPGTCEYTAKCLLVEPCLSYPKAND